MAASTTVIGKTISNMDRASSRGATAASTEAATRMTSVMASASLIGQMEESTLEVGARVGNMVRQLRRISLGR